MNNTKLAEHLIDLAFHQVKDRILSSPTPSTIGCLIKYYALSMYNSLYQFCEDNPDCVCPEMFLGDALYETLNLEYAGDDIETMISAYADVEWHKPYVRTAALKIRIAFEDCEELFKTAQNYLDMEETV